MATLGDAEWKRRFQLKAKSAYAAAQLCARAHPNSTASRAYYAVYAAIKALWPENSALPPKADLIAAENLARIGIRGDSAREIARIGSDLYSARHKADYRPDGFGPPEADDIVTGAARGLAILGVPVL